MIKEELYEALEKEYQNFCKHNVNSRSIDACHTDFFKVLDESAVRRFGYWYLRYTYSIYTYYPNVKISPQMIQRFNDDLRKAFHHSSEKNRIGNALYNTCLFYNDFYLDHVVKPYQQRQEEYNLEQTYLMNKESKKVLSEILIIVFVIAIFVLIKGF